MPLKEQRKFPKRSSQAKPHKGALQCDCRREVPEPLLLKEERSLGCHKKRPPGSERKSVDESLRARGGNGLELSCSWKEQMNKFKAPLGKLTQDRRDQKKSSFFGERRVPKDAERAGRYTSRGSPSSTESTREKLEEQGRKNNAARKRPF